MDAEKREPEVADAVARERARLRQIVDLVPHYIFAKDEDGRFLLVNEAVARAYGTTVAGLLGRTDADFNPNADEVRHFLEDDRRVMATGKPRFVPEEKITEADGSVRWLQTTKIPFTESGTQKPAVLGVAVDVTERKHAEERRFELAERLVGAHRLESLGNLAAGIAHDFNDLLVAIVGNTELAAAHLPTEHAVQPLLRAVGSAARRSADLCRQLLSYSGRSDAVRRRANLSLLLRQASGLFRLQAGPSAELHFELADDLPEVEVDVASVRQAVLDLLSNAVDALAGRPGRVVVRTFARAADPTAGTSGRASDEALHAVIEVEDTGAGMDDSVRARAFEPFFTTKPASSGLGLSRVLAVVRAARGYAEVESTPGSGSKVRLHFPAATATLGPAAAVLLATPPLGAGQRVLVVDDEDFIRDLARLVLEGHGYRVVTAADGEEAVALFEAEAEAIDVVLLDWALPRRGGRDVLEAIRRRRRDAHVVVSSGQARAADEAFEGGERPDAVLAKPYAPVDLLTVVAQSLSGEA